MKLAIAQINCTVGDLSGNTRKILDYANQAKNAGARLVVTPELALSGYPPEDLLLRDGFRHACQKALTELAGRISDVTVVVGHPHLAADKLYNAASVICNGKIIATYLKNLLPNDTVFDERRYFEPGSHPCVFELDGIRFGISICQDIWQEGPATRAREAGAEALLVLNASPYHMNKQALRYDLVRKRIDETGLSIVYANLIGGQDELIFDGASFAMNARGDVTHQFDALVETLGVLELKGAAPVTTEIAPLESLEANVYKALCLGVKDYIGKNRIPGVLLGLSGGVDSALTMTIAVDALGVDKVKAVMMPSQFTTGISLLDARAMAQTLGVRYTELPIEPVFGEFKDTLAREFAALPQSGVPDLTEENLQARIRGTLLMALSNKSGSIVLITGNKSETAVGYSTLYGDMAGGFAVLKDVTKTMVYRLCQYRNRSGKVIPDRVLSRAPSAELRPDQTDQDSLPPYAVLDAILEEYVEHDTALEEILRMGYDERDVRRVIHLIRLNEYKRRQSPPGIRVTSRGFGKDWRYPITARYQDQF
ncbi:NAD+ synthase (glutamine-hydrolysing) [Nitrosospira multiformis]|uniref:Glutamine-dependent NAD(+) synthetase n=1 Tax=Nitrosospira multiformis TaxID=1231 RepID=A0A2T5IG72_9PROT|nr:NAD+ synthase [Nitrosospira multiformis]PTQ82823.1 NAD+ synthase (glutamine-hydrolysing) [Nitrosospira multiformis]